MYSDIVKRLCVRSLKRNDNFYALVSYIRERQSTKNSQQQAYTDSRHILSPPPLLCCFLNDLTGPRCFANKLSKAMRKFMCNMYDMRGEVALDKLRKHFAIFLRHNSKQVK